MDIKKAFNIGVFIATTALVSSCDDPNKAGREKTQHLKDSVDSVISGWDKTPEQQIADMRKQLFSDSANISDMKLKAFISNPDEEPVDPAVPSDSANTFDYK